MNSKRIFLVPAETSTAALLLCMAYIQYSSTVSSNRLRHSIVLKNTVIWDLTPCGSCLTDVSEERITSIIRVASSRTTNPRPLVVWPSNVPPNPSTLSYVIYLLMVRLTIQPPPPPHFHHQSLMYPILLILFLHSQCFFLRNVLKLLFLAS
jgi:hypothetical protein